MISAGDFRNGVTFEMDGNVYQIIEFHIYCFSKQKPSFFTAHYFFFTADQLPFFFPFTPRTRT